MEAAAVLNEIAQQVSVCQKCNLQHSRKRSVPGEGPANAEIMLIGEGPGFYENEQGRPFVGAAGKFLDELLEKAGVNRSKVFITNVVKCRPPGNRDPLPDELLACGDYLERQIESINPRVIVTLGRFSMARFLPNVRISEVHGQARWVRGRLIVAMFHPAAALHQPSLKASVEQDFARLPEHLKTAYSAKPGTQAISGPQPQPGLHRVQEGAPQQPESPKAAPPPPKRVSLFDLNPKLEGSQEPDPTSETPAASSDEPDGPVQLSLF